MDPHRNMAVARPRLPAQSGFTLVELVLIIVMMGIIYAVAAPRFADRNAFDARGFHDASLAAMRYARQLAVGSGCDIEVSVTAAEVHLRQRASCRSGGFTLEVHDPSGQLGFVVTTPANVSISPTGTVRFNALGQASADTTYTVNGGGESRSIQVVAETGFVHAGP